LEAAEKWMASELKRSIDFLKQQLKSTERLCQQRCDAIDIRNKALEGRMEQPGSRRNTPVPTEVARTSSINSVFAADSSEQTAAYVTDLNRLRDSVSEIKKNMEPLRLRQENFDQEIAAISRKYIDWDQRLGDIAQTVESRLSAGLQMREVNLVHSSAPICQPNEQIRFASTTPVEIPFDGVGSQAAGAKPPSQSLMNQFMTTAFDINGSSSPITEQVQHLTDALSLWKSRQQGCERRLAALEHKVGITPPSTDFNTAFDMSYVRSVSDCCREVKLCSPPDDPGPGSTLSSRGARGGL
jgi:hypothetical protein